VFYEPGKGQHGLRQDPIKSLVVPRPIGWISTVDLNGQPNLAPYSFFNLVGMAPPCVMFASSLRSTDGVRKDSQYNAEMTGEFVVNLSTYAQREAMNVTSASSPPGTNEFAAAGLDTLPSQIVRAPRVKGARAHLECTYLQTVEMPSTRPDRRYFVVFGRVVGVHIDDDLIVDGLVDTARARPIARLGYEDYTVVDEVFEMRWPG
jgi:flavin reductase (DIM6/NTAB) family NADH-FMN oxidoreductase RutF